MLVLCNTHVNNIILSSTEVFIAASYKIYNNLKIFMQTLIPLVFVK